MSSNHCEDCGTRQYGGICPNCHEELYILENQSEDIDFPLSEEFTDKAAEQRRMISARAVQPEYGDEDYD